DRPWEVPFRRGEDDLVAWRPEEGPPRCVERLQAEASPDARAEERRRAEADLLARRLRRLLLPGEGTLPTPFDPPRPLRGGEVAILLRSFTELPLYTEALARHHVPHRVLRGRGFSASPAVPAAAACLGLLAAPRHPVHLASCLRGPLVGLSDATLLRLALPHGALDARVLVGGLPPEALPGEAERLARFVAVVRRLRRELDRLTLVELLQEAWGGPRRRPGPTERSSWATPSGGGNSPPGGTRRAVRMPPPSPGACSFSPIATRAWRWRKWRMPAPATRCSFSPSMPRRAWSGQWCA